MCVCMCVCARARVYVCMCVCVIFTVYTLLIAVKMYAIQEGMDAGRDSASKGYLLSLMDEVEEVSKIKCYSHPPPSP